MARPAAGALAERVARRLAASGAQKADGFAAAVLAWSERTGTERAVLGVEKRLSGIAAAVFGRWAVLGSLGAEEVAPGVLSLTLASRVNDDGRLSELAVELERGGELLWSVTLAFAHEDREDHQTVLVDTRFLDGVLPKINARIVRSIGIVEAVRSLSGIPPNLPLS